jgi:creatinine amidohydrolase
MNPHTGVEVPQIHAGKDETSAMLVLAPELVRREAIVTLQPPPGGDATQALVLDPGASYPWSSDDPRLSTSGVMGDARGASAAHGEIIVARVIEGAGVVIQRLKNNAAAAEPALRRTKRQA